MKEFHHLDTTSLTWSSDSRYSRNKAVKLVLMTRTLQGTYGGGHLWILVLNFTRIAFSTVGVSHSRLTILESLASRETTCLGMFVKNRLKSRLCWWCSEKCWAGVVIFGNNIENRQTASREWKDLQIIRTINWGYLRHEDSRRGGWDADPINDIITGGDIQRVLWLIVFLNEHLWSINYDCAIKPLRWTNPPILACSIKASFSRISYEFFISCPRLWEIKR